MSMKTTHTVIPAQAGIQLIEQSPRSGTENQDIVRFAERFPRWIPACAGMTGF